MDIYKEFVRIAKDIEAYHPEQFEGKPLLMTLRTNLVGALGYAGRAIKDVVKKLEKDDFSHKLYAAELHGLADELENWANEVDGLTRGYETPKEVTDTDKTVARGVVKVQKDLAEIRKELVDFFTGSMSVKGDENEFKEVKDAFEKGMDKVESELASAIRFADKIVK